LSPQDVCVELNEPSPTNEFLSLLGKVNKKLVSINYKEFRATFD